MRSVRASPFDLLLLDDLIDDDGGVKDDYDLHYDQRQNGTENIRLRVDGVVIALPSSSSSQSGSTVGNLASNYLLGLAGLDDLDEDDADNYFGIVKNSQPTNDSNVQANADKDIGESQDKNNVKIEQKDEQKDSVPLLASVKGNDTKSNTILLRNSANVATAAEVVPKKSHLRKRNKWVESHLHFNDLHDSFSFFPGSNFAWAAFWTFWDEVANNNCNSPVFHAAFYIQLYIN